MTCNDVEFIYRIGKRFKSRTSENASKILTSYMNMMRVYRIATNNQ